MSTDVRSQRWGMGMVQRVRCSENWAQQRLQSNLRIWGAAFVVVGGGLAMQVHDGAMAAGLGQPYDFLVTVPVLLLCWFLPLEFALKDWVHRPLSQLGQSTDALLSGDVRGAVLDSELLPVGFAGLAEARNRVLADLEAAQHDTVRRLAIAAEHRDGDTGAHIRRIGDYCALLAEAAGLDPTEVETLRVASQLHDVGKIGIEDAVLQKPGRLTAEERAVMERHTIMATRSCGTHPPSCYGWARWWRATTTSAGTGPATPIASPARRSPWRRGSAPSWTCTTR